MPGIASCQEFQLLNSLDNINDIGGLAMLGIVGYLASRV